MKWNPFSKKDQSQNKQPDLTDPDAALRYLLESSLLRDGLDTPSQVRDGQLYCPEWQMTLAPAFEQLGEQNAVVHLHLYAPQWGKEMFECSAALGESTGQAIDMACISFVSSFMDGITKMQRGETYDRLETAFAGRPHRWEVFLSNVVGLGESPRDTSAGYYWDLLKEEIAKRLGNQKVCYIKVYAARSLGDVIGECRIDDVKSEELSALVAQVAEKWDVEQFASQKVFFFIRQDEETTLPYPYLGPDGQQLFREKIRTAVSLFYACEDEEQYDRLFDSLLDALGDATLARECCSFLPEMCTENAFPQVQYAESILLVPDSGETVTCYKSQLADYWPMSAALFGLFSEGVFGEDTDKIYQRYIGMSASYGALSQMLEKGDEEALKGGRLSALLYAVEDGFEFR